MEILATIGAWLLAIVLLWLACGMVTWCGLAYVGLIARPPS